MEANVVGESVGNATYVFMARRQWAARILPAAATVPESEARMFQVSDGCGDPFSKVAQLSAVAIADLLPALASPPPLFSVSSQVRHIRGRLRVEGPPMITLMLRAQERPRAGAR
jgi:hypothetical protein